jgi:ribonuclease BN (tRNA processing enzyme)
VATKEQQARIVEYLKMGNPDTFISDAQQYLGKDTINSYLREQILNADRIDEKMVYTFTDMVDFVTFDQLGQADVGEGVIIETQKNGTFLVKDGKKPPLTLEGRSENLQEIDITFEGIKPLMRDMENSVLATPDFGVTVLGQSSGMNPKGLTVNHIVHAGDINVLFDIGSATIPELKALGITPKDISNVFITHMHEDHVSGALAYFEWAKQTGGPIRIISEPGILEFFKEQLKMILNKNIEEAYHNIEFIPVHFNEKIELIKNDTKVELETAMAWHSGPTVMTRINYKEHTLSLSSDHKYDPEVFEKIEQNKLPNYMREDLKRYKLDNQSPVFTKQRMEEWSYPNGFLFKKNVYGHRPVIIHEVGGPADVGVMTGNHTSPKALSLLPQEIQNRVIVNHNSATLPEDAQFHQAMPLTTYAITLQGFVSWKSPESSRNSLRSSPQTAIQKATFEEFANKDMVEQSI